MRYRTTKILESEDLGASGTKVIDIKVLDPLSRMDIIFKATNGGTAIANHPAANISKIELIDGSEVLASVSGKQLHALNFYQEGDLPYCYICNINSLPLTFVGHLNFGRYLYDPELGFDPKKFRNPQLRITFNEAVAQVDATENICQVIGHVFDEVTPSLAGMIRQMEQYSYTITAGGKQYVDLPQDHLLRDVYVRCEDYGTNLGTNIENLKVSEDRDKKVPVDLSFDVLEKLISNLYGSCLGEVTVEAATGDADLYVAPAYNMVGVGFTASEAQDAKTLPVNGGKITVAAGTVSGQIMHTIRGVCPHNMFPVINARESDFNKWYDVTGLGQSEMIVEGASGADGTETVEILTEQLYRY